jgi:hypothetical protein
MQTQPTIEPTGSPVPGVILEPLRAHRDTVAAHERPAATPTASGTIKAPSSRGRRNLASTAFARLLSALRGDKYMVDASPPAWHGAAAARVGDEVTPPSHNGDVAAGVLAGAASVPDTAAVASRTKER